MACRCFSVSREAIVEQCQQAKLVAVEARVAIQEHLTALFASEAVPLENPEAGGGEVPLPEPLLGDPSSARPTPLPVILSEAEREELTADNAARHDWIAEDGRPRREVHGLYRRTADFKVSTTDPDATPMRLKGEVSTWATMLTTS